MLQRYFYGTLAALGLTVLLLADILLIVPLASSPLVVLGISLVFYGYLLYLILFRKII